MGVQERVQTKIHAQYELRVSKLLKRFIARMSGTCYINKRSGQALFAQGSPLFSKGPSSLPSVFASHPTHAPTHPSPQHRKSPLTSSSFSAHSPPSIEGLCSRLPVRLVYPSPSPSPLPPTPSPSSSIEGPPAAPSSLPAHLFPPSPR